MPRWPVRFCTAVLCAIAYLAAASPALAGKRIALVIGNGAYDNLTKLNNPGNDAKAVAALLEANGIKPTLKLDLSHAELLVALNDFEVAARGAELALLYYAGHGVHLAGKDVLLPKDVAQKCGALSEEDALKGTVFVDKAIDAMKAARNRVVILDACRTSTFPSCPPKRGADGGGFRALGRIEAKGTLIATSVAPGGLADDGAPGGNSPYASRLLKLLKERPNAYFHDVLIDVNREMAAAGGAEGQSGDLYFAGGVPPSACLSAERCGEKVAAAQPAPTPLIDAAELARLKAEIEALKRKQSEQQQANLAPPPKPEPAIRPAEPVPPAASADMAPGTTFRDCPECPEMVVVPAGSFTMGSSPSEIAALTKEYGDYFKDEGPTRKVTIAKPFAVGKLEVTRDEFEAFIKATGRTTGDKCWTFENNKAEERSGRSFRNPGFKQEGNHPVVCVSWDDAKAYVAWLSQKSGKSYRLLTEAEWEYATRGGTTTRYSYGNGTGEQCGFANGADQTAKASGLPKEWTYAACKDGYDRTAAVGSFKPNAFGLYDMHGNVWEWVEDCYKDSYQGAPTDGSASTSGDCSGRVLRGGSWDNDPGFLRSAGRSGDPTDVRSRLFGLRVGRTF